MPGLKIQVFGKLRMRYGDGTIEFFPTRRSEELLSYLLLNQAVQLPRERLVEMLWPDQALSNGRASLSTALWRLRSVFNQLGVSADDYLQASRDWVRFLPRESLSLDMSDFEQLLDQAARADQVSDREESRSLVGDAEIAAAVIGAGAEPAGEAAKHLASRGVPFLVLTEGEQAEAASKKHGAAAMLSRDEAGKELTRRVSGLIA